jgi:hypothetical protein
VKRYVRKLMNAGGTCIAVIAAAYSSTEMWA